MFRCNKQKSNLFQLGPHRDPDMFEPDYTWAAVRWEQTFEIGFTPNQGLPNVYTAIAMDLPDFEVDPYVLISLLLSVCLRKETRL